MGNPFVHMELSTDDAKGALKFYKKVFDWKITASPSMDYSMVNTGSKLVGGGIQTKQMQQAPTAWMPYVEVASVKKSLAKAAKAGATVIVDFMPIGEMGAIGVFVDPTGAALGVWEKAPKKVKKPAKKAAKKVAKKRSK